MAKKSAGASEINGFISINKDEIKNASKTSTTKKTAPPAAKSAPKNETKLSKDSSAKTTTRKAVPDKPTKTMVKMKVSPGSKETEPKVKTGLSSKISSKTATKNEKAPTKRTADLTKQATPDKSQSSTIKSTKATTRVQNSSSKVAKTAPPTKKDVPPNQIQPKGSIEARAKESIRGTVRAENRTTASKSIAEKNLISKLSVDKQGKPKNQKDTVPLRSKQTSKALPLKAKAAEKLTEVTSAADAKVLGKNGLSYNVILEPAKSAKPTSLTDIDRNRSVENQKEKLQLPAQLVKQGTFVKDEDEETKISLSHAAPDESSAQDGAYEGDFEEYESDFEDATETETSLSETSKAGRVAALKKTQAVSSTLDENASKSEQRLLLKAANSKDFQENGDNSIELLRAEKSTSQGMMNGPEQETNIYDYEDDFEDYSSDFEEDTESGFTSSIETTSESSTSTSSADVAPSDVKVGSKLKLVIEEERKLDSGNYDMKTTSLRSEAIRMNQLNDIKEAISRENTMFKDGIPSTKVASSPTVQIMDFKAAVDIEEKRSRRNPSRGKLLMSMIRLHTMDYHLFEMEPLPYDDYIQLRGNTNFIQEQNQTNEDAVWEETQTDEISSVNKWTQCPVSYHSWAGKEIDWRIYLEDKKGFGSDELPTMARQQFFASNYNTKRLHNFISSAAQLMTVILEEEAQGFSNILSLRKTDKNFGFSDGYVPIYCDDIDFLKDRRVTHITFSPHFPNIIVACYDTCGSSEEDYLPVEVTRRWLICLWDIIVVSQPLKILVASAPIHSVIFDSLYSDLIFAGLSNGIICLWDLSEPDLDHDHCEHKNFKSILRSPTFCTFSMSTDSKEAHVSSVIELKSTSRSSRPDEDGITPTTLYSMCEDGKVILWTVVRTPDNRTRLQRKADVRLSPWGRVSLSLTSIHQPALRAPKKIRDQLVFLCMAVKESSVTSLLLGTNKGCVLQYPMVRLKAVIPNFGEPNIALQVTSIELCPHEEKCFIVGISDGTVRLHSENVSQPLKVLTVPDLPPTAIVSLKWSNLKAGLIVSLDQNSNLIVWNICKSDLYPLVKMAFKVPHLREELIQKAMESNPNLVREELDRTVKFVLPTSGLRRSSKMNRMDLSSDIRLPYLGVVVSDATVHVHRFNDEFAPKGAELKNEDLQILRKYLDILQR